MSVIKRDISFINRIKAGELKMRDKKILQFYKRIVSLQSL